jgi:hypothetical protein
MQDTFGRIHVYNIIKAFRIHAACLSVCTECVVYGCIPDCVQ